MSIKCRIWWVPSAQGYAVVFAYGKKDLVEALKSVIPSGDRTWDEVARTWYIKEHYGEAIRNLASAAFGASSVSFTSKQVSEQSSQQQRTYGQMPQRYSSTTTVEDAIVSFISLVPYEAAKRAYLLAAQSLHPDKGGDSVKMMKLNEVWGRIEKEFYKR